MNRIDSAQQMLHRRRTLVALLIVICGAAFMGLLLPIDSSFSADLEMAPSTSITLTAVADVTLRSWEADTNYGDQHYLELSYENIDEQTQNEAVILVRFDLTSLPDRAVIDAASLRLFLGDASGPAQALTGAYLITNSWDESSVSWSTPINTELLGLSSSIDSTTGSYKSWSIPSFAQLWHDDPASNYGVMLRGATEGASFERWFESRDHMEMVPQLELTYHLAPYEFSGHVYEGDPDDVSIPMGDVTVGLWGDQDEWPDAGFERVRLAADETASTDGTFALEWTPDVQWPFLHVVEEGPPGSYSTGADADPPGQVVDPNTVSYRYDDMLETGLLRFDGIAFWDRFPVAQPDLTVTDIWPEGDAVCARIQNVGAGTGMAGHQAALAIDEVQHAVTTIGVELAPSDWWEGCFDYTWVCGDEADMVIVEADYADALPESDETNNRRGETWQCDRTPPEIVTGPTVNGITSSSATISWQTDEVATGFVRYDTVVGSYGWEEVGSGDTTNHQVTLSGLASSTAYHFIVGAVDPAGNQVESRDRNFETLAQPDGENPTVRILDPGVISGTTTIRAAAEDNRGIDRVEFHLNGELVFTDYSPPYEWVFFSNDGDNGEKTLKATAIDLSGGINVDESKLLVANFFDEEAPKVHIFHPNDGDNVYGETPVWVTVSDDSGWSQVDWYVDGTKMGGGQFPLTPPKNIRFWWDTRFFLQGSHRVGVQATDGDNKVGFDTIDVVVANTEPPLRPKLAVTNHKVFRHGHTFVIELTVENQGQVAAYDIEIREEMNAFQPLSRTYNGATYSAIYNPVTRSSRCVIQDNGGLSPGNSRTYVCIAIPVLLHPNPQLPSMGDGLSMAYASSQGAKYLDALKHAVLATTAGAGSAPSELIYVAHASALKETDYLIVTGPNRLFALNPFQTADVNALLADMAQLAFDKDGALGYMATPNNNTLRNLIRPKGNWANRLMSSFSKQPGIGGYLLIVGETDVIPAWDLLVAPSSCSWCPAIVNDSDHNYADTYAGWPPDIIVGRIIGEEPADLSRAIRASTSGNGIDRADALVVSGTGGGQDKFVQNVDDIEGVLKGDKFSVEKLHWKDYTSTASRLQEFRNRVADKDVIFFRDHCGPDSWSDPSALTTADFPVNLGNTNPLVIGCCCSSGDYEGGDDQNIAEAFFDEGAAVYIGSTEDSPRDPNNEGCQNFFENWDANKSIGWSWTLSERVLTTSSDSEAWWRYWGAEYNLYGDPKFGAEPAANPLRQADLHEPAAAIDVTVPDYVVDNVDGVDRVEIPGGLLLLEEGEPQVPYYVATIDYGVGYEINDVYLEKRSGLVTDGGLHLPLTTMAFNGYASAQISALVDQEAWFPEEAYSWQVLENTDGSITLVISIYPFVYNQTTTEVNFYKSYHFDVDYVFSERVIDVVTTDKDAYTEGEGVIVTLGLLNPMEGDNVFVGAVVSPYGANAGGEGMPLEKLTDLRGDASYAFVWNSQGVEPGYYSARVALQDIAGNLLDQQTVLFQLGVTAGEISEFVVTPPYFDVGDSIDISLVFKNTGSVGLTGSAVIEIQDDAGIVVETVEQPYSNLASGEELSVNSSWVTAGSEEGTYAVVGYVSYDGGATEAVVSMVSSGDPESATYLPIIVR